MKRVFFISLLLSIGFPFLSIGQSISAEGTIRKEGELYKEAEVLLYERNEVIGKTRPNWLGTFSFRLSLNSHYTVEVRSEGHVTKRISFDTRVPEEVEDPDPSDFSFDVLMLEADRIPEEHEGLFDFPVGRVFFDPYQEEFRFNTKYTSRIRREFRKALKKDERTVERTE